MTHDPTHDPTNDRPSIAELKAVAQPPEHIARYNAEHWAGALYIRHLSIYATRALLPTHISPNGVTWLMILTGLVGALAIPFGGLVGPIVAVLAMQLQILLDCSDGEVARWRQRFSPAGIYLDRIGHYVTEGAIPVAIGLRADGWSLSAPGDVGGWTALGMLVALGVLLNKAFTDLVHVARAKTGRPPLEDVEGTARPKASGMAAAATRLRLRADLPGLRRRRGLDPRARRCRRRRRPRRPARHAGPRRRDGAAHRHHGRGPSAGRAVQLEARLMTGSEASVAPLPVLQWAQEHGEVGGVRTSHAQLTSVLRAEGIPVSYVDTGSARRAASMLPRLTHRSLHLLHLTRLWRAMLLAPAFALLPGRTVLVLHSGSTGGQVARMTAWRRRALVLALYAYDEIWAVNDEIGAILPAALRARITVVTPFDSSAAPVPSPYEREPHALALATNAGLAHYNAQLGIDTVRRVRERWSDATLTVLAYGHDSPGGRRAASSRRGGAVADRGLRLQRRRGVGRPVPRRHVPAPDELGR